MRIQSLSTIRKISMHIFIMLLAISAPGIPAIEAQTTGTIYGTVTDSTGATIVGATVTVKNTATNLTRSTVTDAEGLYRFTLLPVGIYSITVEASGFKPFSRESVELQVEQNIRADFTLEVGRVTEQVTVTTQAPQVDTASSTLGKVVEEKRIVDLPLNGRNFLQLGVLQAGVTPPIPGIDSLGSGTNSTPGGTAFNFSVNGMRISSNNHLLDGVNNVEPMTGAAMIVPSPDTLREFRILTNAYNAEYGRAGGSIVTVITKSGSNEYHGSAYEFLRNDVFDARNFFAPEVPTLKQNQFGATFGGRIIRNKTFFFGGYEGFRQRKGIPISTTVPSLLVRQGDFSQEAIKPIDPLTGQPFPGNVIPQNRIDPIARRIIDLFPAPNLGPNLFSHAPVDVNDRDQFILRGDHTLIEGKNVLTGRYLFDDGSLLSHGGARILNIGNTDVPGFEFVTPTRFQNLMVADTHIFSATVLNEFRFSYQRANVRNNVPVNIEDPASLGFTYPITGTPIVTTPGIAVAGHSALGYSFFNERLSDFYEFIDNVAVTTGKHSVKFGGNIRRTHIDGLFPSLVFGNFSFVGIITGNPLGDLLLGRPFLFLQAGGKPDKSLKQTAYYFYVQDDFR
ncbi:MAG TPA: carboxypeptidase-like regulatory domain-containing protein, partial [Blastocatellia bacterium]|nr:carboxypeptidase-like regulatory domain-containing protein [Blastocatellia bacterium]